MNRRRRAQLTVALCALVLLVPVGVAVAQVATHSATAGVTYTTNSNVAVTLGDQRSISNSPFDDTQTFNSSGLRISGSDANVTVTDNSFNSYPITVRNVDVSGSLTVERTDLNKDFTVESGDASLLQVRDYQLDDGSADIAYESNSGVDLTLGGFGPITVVAVDRSTGNELDRVPAGSDGEATFTLPSGSRSVELRSIYETDSGVTISVENDSRVPDNPFDGSDTFVAGDVTVSGSNAQVDITEGTYSDYPITVRNVDVSGSLTVERTDLNKDFTVESGDASLLQVRDYQLDDGTEDLAYSSTNGLTVTLSGLPDVNVAVVEAGTGDPIDEVAASSGEATIDLPSGTNSIRLETAPGDLEVRNEARPNQLIDENVTLRARLFSDDGTVVEREVTDGTVSLDGVPLDEELIVTVKEENADFVYRRILLDSAIENSEIYLLPTNDPSAEIEFQLRDETGRFQTENTKLFVEKPITRDYDGDGTNETRYQPISGDRIGGDGSFPTILQSSERYRLRVENDAGEQRVLGSYTVTGAERTVLPIGEVTFREDVDEGAALQASLEEAAAGASYDHEVRLVYIDPEQQTESIDVEITDSNGNNIRPSSTENLTGVDRYVETYPITDSGFDPTQNTATVSVEALRGGQIETFDRKLGDVPDVFTNVPLSTQAIEVISLGSIVAVTGLLVLISAPLAALVGTGYAGLLSLVGLAPIPMPAVVLAGVVGVVATVGSRRI